MRLDESVPAVVQSHNASQHLTGRRTGCAGLEGCDEILRRCAGRQLDHDGFVRLTAGVEHLNRVRSRLNGFGKTE